MQLSNASTRVVAPEDRERHSLDQLSLLRQLGQAQELSINEAIFLATQLVQHGFHTAGQFLDRFLGATQHASVRYYLTRLKRRHANIQALPHLPRVLGDERRLRALYDPALGSYFIPGTSRSDTAVVVFTTVNNNFGVSNAVLDAVLDELGVARLYLKDATRFIYFRGVSGLSGSLRGLPEAVTHALRQSGIHRILVTGVSSGGLPAIYTAAALDAVACLAFSACTDFSVNSTLPQPRMHMNIANEVDPGDRINTHDVISASKAGPGSFRFYYGLDHPIDRPHALHLSGLPQMRLVGLDHCGHGAVGALVERGSFAAAFAEALMADDASLNRQEGAA